MACITPNQTFFVLPRWGHCLLNVVHRDEPEEASEPLGITYVSIFVERSTLLRECSALTREVNKLLACLTTESAFICQ